MRLGKPVVAARLYGFVEKRLESLSVNLLYTDQAEFGRIRKMLACLDEATLEAAIAEGWDMNEEQALALVGEIIEEN